MHNWMIRIQQGNPHFGLMIHISFSPEQKLHDMFMAIVACRVQGCPSILKSCQKKNPGVWCTLNCKDNLEPHTACNLWKCSSHVNMLWANFYAYLFWWIYCAMSCVPIALSACSWKIDRAFRKQHITDEGCEICCWSEVTVKLVTTHDPCKFDMDSKTYVSASLVHYKIIISCSTEVWLVFWLRERILNLGYYLVRGL